MAEETVLTPEGLAKLKQELDHLKTHERMRIANNIREAKSHGDLRENAMYHEAKLNQQRLDARIADLERSILNAKIIQPGEHQGIHLGTKLTLLDIEWNEELEFELVSAHEADPANGKISIASPLGVALTGKEEGDEVEVDAPMGQQRYRICRLHG